MARMKKQPADLTVEILKQIRDTLSGTNERLDATNQRLDETKRELSERIGRVETRLTPSFPRSRHDDIDVADGSCSYGSMMRKLAIASL